MSLNQSRGYDNLPEFSKDMYKETYFLPNENYSDWLERLTEAYCDDYEHASRIKEYIWNYWFHPSTPVSANAGLPTRGLPISCFTNEVKDRGDFDDWSGPVKLAKEIDTTKWQVFDLFNFGIIKNKPASTGLTLVRRK